MRALDDHLARAHLRMIERLIERIDWPAGNALGIQNFFPLDRRPRLKLRANQVREEIPIFVPSAIRREARIGAPFRRAEHVTEASPALVPGRAERDVAVGGPINSVRRVDWMMVT